MAILKGSRDAEVVPPEQRGNLSWNKPAKGGLVPIKVDNKDKGRKKSFSKKTAQEAGAEYTKQKARNAANKQSSYKSPNLLKGVGKFHRSITGTNSAFSSNKANLVFMGGMTLIIASGASSHRLSDIFGDALNPQRAITSGNSGRLWRNLRIIGSQLIWVVGLTFLSRMSNALGNIFLVIISGMFLLWVIRNPQVFYLLNAWSEDGTTTATLPNKLTAFDVQRLFPGFIAGEQENTNVTPQLHQAITNAINSLNNSRK